MVKRQQPISSPFVNKLLNDGWSRRDAEDLEVVQIALEQATDPSAIRMWSPRAVRVLRREPVRIGAFHLFPHRADALIGLLD